MNLSTKSESLLDLDDRLSPPISNATPTPLPLGTLVDEDEQEAQPSSSSSPKSSPSSPFTTLRRHSFLYSDPIKTYELADELPKGWVREVSVCRKGLIHNFTSVKYYSPTGRVFESKGQLVRHFGTTFDLTGFSFKTGKINQALRKYLYDKKIASPHYTDEREEDIKFDTTVISPTRQLSSNLSSSSSTLKRPITLLESKSKTVKDIPLNMTGSGGSSHSQIKPKQVFWHKRFDEQDDENESKTVLPNKIQKIQPGSQLGALASLSTALHNKSKTPIVGQSKIVQDLENLDPAIFINPDQPMVQELSVDEEDIRHQESQLREARKRLADAVSISYV